MPSLRDREILRSLAARWRQIADTPAQKALRADIEALNALRPTRPIILTLPEGAWDELLPPSQLQCEDEICRGFELQLRRGLYQVEQIRDDTVLLPFFNINWTTKLGDYGVEIPTTHGENRGSYHWDPPIKDLERDFARLRHRAPTVDRTKTQQRLDLAGELFGDLLPPRIRCYPFWTTGLTWDLIKLVGLEQLMLYMLDAPEQVHRYMAFLRDDLLAVMDWFDREQLLSPNADVPGACGSGGSGLTRELPINETTEHRPARFSDLWGLSESQETVGVSPDMFAEFVLPYQKPLMARFGLVYYGCCEPLHQRIAHILTVPNLRRVSVSPWADQPLMAERLRGRYVYCRKPNPALVCVEFNEQAIREDLRTTIRICREARCPLEIILKDTHTVQNQPQRISRWVQIAREEAEL